MNVFPFLWKLWNFYVELGFFLSSDSETSFTQQNVASLFQNGNGMDVPEAEGTVIRKQRKRTKWDKTSIAHNLE